MKNRRKRVWLGGIAAVCILLAAGVAVDRWFHSPGLHILGPFWSFDLSAECYRFELPAQGEPNGAVTVNVQGTANRIQNEFHGVITVDGLDTKGDSEGVHDQLFYLEEGGSGHIMYIDSWFTRDESGALRASFDGYFFYVTLEPDGTLTMLAQYEEGDTREACFAAVQADSAEEARTRYEALVAPQLQP